MSTLGRALSWGRLWAVGGRLGKAHADQRRPTLQGSELRRERYDEAAEVPPQFLRNKKQEWEEYRSEVTAFELRKNLPVL
ncbi:glutamine synthetase [Streptomyces subrutilus]|uniref:glutamine synthetase n=1 Tax=Streptomyces subrutilus TaxID=36818 RepID=UPI0026B295BA